MKPTIIETEEGIFRADKILSVTIEAPNHETVHRRVMIVFDDNTRHDVKFERADGAERFLFEIKTAMRKIPESALEEHEKIPKCKFYGANKIQQCWGAICSARSFSGDDYWLCEGHDSNGNFSPQVVLTDSIKEQPSTESVKQR